MNWSVRSLLLNPDPFNFWHSSQKRDPGLNLALYDNVRVDTLLEEARQAMSFEDRASKFAQLQEIIIDDAPAVLLYSPTYVYVVNKRTAHQVPTKISFPSDRLNLIDQWYTQTRRIFN